ncbi:hypothetical protein SLU01_14440 [Sporosarcina luteola]|uniref:Uncharacterized protein n=1 Tax=Sporosarcina luteola TaxID=582850 RepID=A0A511Z6Q7_9BACL|nr:hypothetical protein SLU01_14440 [Sporosarcina luteola]
MVVIMSPRIYVKDAFWHVEDKKTSNHSIRPIMGMNLVIESV